jgi:urease accessory protein
LTPLFLTEGIAEIGFGHQEGVTRLTHLYQRDPLRVLFPTPDAGDPALAVIVTTSGGLVAGDRLDIAVRLAPGAVVHVTASAAEKIYRSTGPTTTIHQSLAIAPARDDPVRRRSSAARDRNRTRRRRRISRR